MLSTQSWSVGAVNIVRTSGLFREPGHFGMVCAGVLVANGFRFDNVRFKWVAIGGFLTLSPAFYLFFLMAVFVKNTSRLAALVKAILLMAALIPGLVLILNALPETLLNRLILSNVEAFVSGGARGVVAERTRGGFNLFYDNLSMPQKFYGVGEGAHVEEGFVGAQASDYRLMVVRAGVISLAFYCLFVFYLAFCCRRRADAILIILFFLLVAGHRSGMLLQMWFPLLISLAALRPLHTGMPDHIPLVR